MKKLMIALVVLVGVGFVAKRFGPKFENVDWEKRFASLPDNAPPKWMFRNISDIRDHTDRILGLLENRSADTQLVEHASPSGTASGAI